MKDNRTTLEKIMDIENSKEIMIVPPMSKEMQKFLRNAKWAIKESAKIAEKCKLRFKQWLSK